MLPKLGGAIAEFIAGFGFPTGSAVVEGQAVLKFAAQGMRWHALLDDAIVVMLRYVPAVPTRPLKSLSPVLFKPAVQPPGETVHILIGDGGGWTMMLWSQSHPDISALVTELALDKLDEEEPAPDQPADDAPP